MPSSRPKAFEPLVEVAQWLYSLLPNRFRIRRPKKISLNFIAAHYLYMIAMSMVVSVVLWGGGLIPYIDALFFATGAATQSGLNTIDVNKLELYQQVVMMLVACVCNPIFINTFVVFVRLYWFEKRFKHIVQQMRDQRRSRSKTFSHSKTDDEEGCDPAKLESGVNGREIKVLHETTKPNGMTGTAAKLESEKKEFAEMMGLDSSEDSATVTPGSSNKSTEGDDTEALPKSNDHPEEAEEPHHLGLNPKLHRDVTFVDEIRRPAAQDHAKHLDFLERQQRNAKEGSAIRIPGPRDFDRGELPKHLNDPDEHELDRFQTRNTYEESPSRVDWAEKHDEPAHHLNSDDHTTVDQNDGATHLTFNEPDRPDRQKGSTLERMTTGASRLQRARSSANNVLRHSRNSSMNRPGINEGRTSLARTFSNLTTIRSRNENEDPMPYLSWQATAGRNSAFVGLTEEQREELGGIEYRSLKTLAAVLVCYYVGFHVLAMVVNTPWIMHTQPWKGIVQDYGVSPGWWGVFTSASLFNDLGFTLTPNSLISFQNAILVLIFGSFLIVIGNTGFPCMLRFVIWVASKLVPYGSGIWEELRFLLDHPRRCFTLLFPSKATWWLFWVLVLLNGVDLIFYIILDINDDTVLSLPPGIRVLTGWFQATSTRTAGFSVVNLADLHPAVQVSYLIMMYISVFPIAISVRRTNVYEEKSLGIWNSDEPAPGDDDPSYVGQHLRRQLSFDLWYVFLGFFIISIAEGTRVDSKDQWAFTMFSILFEIVSAYGTVGLSLGYPDKNASFSTEFHPVSKLVIIAMMLRGRHRGLPYRLDRAILLPSENLQKKEAEEADRRHANRRPSMATTNPGVGDSGTAAMASGANGSEVFSPVSRRSGGLEAEGAETGTGTDGAHLGVGEGVRHRNSGMSSNGGKRERSRSLGRVIAGGLGAGPSISKHD